VIVGRRIPAGTGHREYRRSYVPADAQAVREEAGRIVDAQAAAMGSAADAGALRPVPRVPQTDQATGA